MKKLLLFAFAIVLFASSCKKDCPAPEPATNLSGTTWTGTTTFAAMPGTPYPITLNFNADGTLTGNVVDGIPYPINGTWNLVPGSVSVKMFFTISTVTGTFNGQANLGTGNTQLESGIATNATSPIYNMSFTATKS